MNQLNHLSQDHQKQLFDDLYYLKMGQLRALCEHFKVPKAGKKVFLITLLKRYLLTGEILKPKPLPDISCAPKGAKGKLSADALILSGLYKSDLKTRFFMKSLIGNHFHFTAYGLDWINERWQKGDPPTYREFADAWQAEYEATRDRKRPPKKEWAYINFCLDYQKAHPKASKKEVMQRWKDKQAVVAKKVTELLYAL